MDSTLTTPNADKTWSIRNTHVLLLQMQHGIALLEYSLEASYRTKWDLATMILGIYPKEVKISVHATACMQMFVAVLFIIAKTLEATKKTLSR